MYIHVFTITCAHIHMNTCTHLQIYLQAYLNRHPPESQHMSASVYVYTCGDVLVCICIYMYIYIYIHVHTCTCIHVVVGEISFELWFCHAQALRSTAQHEALCGGGD